MFRELAQQVAQLSAGRPCRILELGSGPGFLAQAILAKAPNLTYVGIDNSPAMHFLARERNSDKSSQIALIERSFKDSEWPKGLGKFDLVVTNQAVHELRHRCHATSLHQQVAEVLNTGGVYLVSDHFLGEGAMSNPDLYMTQDEQLECLRISGFVNVVRIFQIGDLVLHKAS
jgi:SAM-dependent methyltransferase